MTDADNAVTVTLLREAAEWIEMRAYSEACATAAETIERQGKAIEDLELRLHQTNDAHALSCSEHLKALTEIERQGKALRAVEALCFQREQMMAGEPNPAFAAQLTTAEVRAALAQTEPQT